MANDDKIKYSKKDYIKKLRESEETRKITMKTDAGRVYTSDLHDSMAGDFSKMKRKKDLIETLRSKYNQKMSKAKAIVDSLAGKQMTDAQAKSLANKTVRLLKAKGLAGVISESKFEEIKQQIMDGESYSTLAKRMEAPLRRKQAMNIFRGKFGEEDRKQRSRDRVRRFEKKEVKESAGDIGAEVEYKQFAHSAGSVKTSDYSGPKASAVNTKAASIAAGTGVKKMKTTPKGPVKAGGAGSKPLGF